MAETVHTSTELRDNEIPARAQWEARMAAWQAVEAIPDEVSTDADIDLAGYLMDRLLGMPSPDAKALCWKLDYLLGVDNDSTSSWSADFIAQTVADYRRLLGSA